MSVVSADQRRSMMPDDAEDPGRARERFTSEFRVVTIYVAGMLLYFISLRGALRTFPQTWYFSVGPGTEPPWYFIGDGWIHALWAFPCAFLLLLAALAAARWIGPAVWAALGVTLISFADAIGQGLNIAWHTDNIWDRTQATTAWPTFDAYMRSSQTASQVSMTVAIIVAASLIMLYTRGLFKARR